MSVAIKDRLILSVPRDDQLVRLALGVVEQEPKLDLLDLPCEAFFDQAKGTIAKATGCNSMESERTYEGKPLTSICYGDCGPQRSLSCRTSERMHPRSSSFPCSGG